MSTLSEYKEAIVLLVLGAVVFAGVYFGFSMQTYPPVVAVQPAAAAPAPAGAGGGFAGPGAGGAAAGYGAPQGAYGGGAAPGGMGGGMSAVAGTAQGNPAYD